MPTNQPLTVEEKSSLQDRLEKLDKEAILLFSARCALRVFPLLAQKNDHNASFYYWDEQDKTRCLLAVWRALLFYYRYNKSDARADDAAARAAYDAADNAAANAAYAADANAANAAYAADANAANAAYAARAAVYAAYDAAADANAATRAARAAYDANVATRAAIAATNAAAYVDYFPDIRTELESDLIQLKKGNRAVLDRFPLWQKTDPDYLNWLEKHLPEALNELSEEQSVPNVKAIIDDIWPIYKGIFEGKPDKGAINQTLGQLESFFSHSDSVSEKNNEDEPPSEVDVSSEQNNGTAEPPYDQETPIESIETIPGNRHSSHQHAAEDKLNRQHLVNSLAALLRDKNNPHHQTIGLLGHWGVGKTSVVELLKTALKTRIEANEPEFLFADFNAWEYEHTDNLQAGIAQEMIKALSSPEPEPTCWESTYWPLRKIWLTARFAWRLHGLKVLIPLSLFVSSLAPLWIPDSLKEVLSNLVEPLGTGVASIFPYAWIGTFLLPALKHTKALFAGPLAKELLTYLKLPNYGQHLGTIPVMREHIKKLTKVRLGNKKRLLYVVDDLDRCGHKGIVKVLEAVRMVLDLDNVIVVIAVDQRIALAALALHYKELATQHHNEDPKLIARDYLAKIIHLPIVLTEPDDASVTHYLEYLWDQTSSPESKEQGDGALAKTDDGLANGLPNDNTERENQTKTTEKVNHVSQEENNPLKTDRNINSEATDAPSFTGTFTGTEAHPSTEPDRLKETLKEALKKEFKEKYKELKQVEQLTEPQKRAFAHWIKHFGLSNPRQIKRLHNSYNLLLNLYPDQDKESVELTREDVEPPLAAHHFPMMVTLFAMEYLNNLESITMRKALKERFKQEAGSKDTTPESEEHDKITDIVIKLGQMKVAGKTAIKAIEPFVLPSIDIDVNRDNDEEAP
ncbi:KAP family P-loop NTPase fold protein [Marinomonas mediterranea]|uniref:KAP P-loop domain protein n=1 Tax=Marinomonas mediterranea (strain ATCC 700492 / JCM 21426 / NBRC 103028 / MMB-1) TaxID=717774 RepID=F2JUX2_MARM1|nr:KAP P-loop domain-containing protein [Marinomonas mediterranea]ADZ91626.1 KAP P-loop domain protein [Marinomonas mediterranea MMB-1]WCN17727.1 hypothetical protein GV053_12055 [Marinomonas mediterranea MMB-1]